MTNKEMEEAIKWIKQYVDIASEKQINDKLFIYGLSETEIRYCYVLATGKNMTI